MDSPPMGGHMPEEGNVNEGNSESAPNDQTVNLGGKDPGEISMLRSFRNSPSSGEQKESTQEGESSSQTGQGGSETNREPAIPRDRFDQVNQQKNQFQQENQQLRQQMQQFMQAMQQQSAPQQGAYNPTGMVGQQPQPPQQQQQSGQQQNLPDFNNPEVQKEWRKKLGDNPIKGMVEMFQVLLQKEGAPMLQQAISQVQQQIQPVQQAYAQQAVSQYAQQRTSQDPQFQQLQPVFQDVVTRALQERPNLQLNPQTLQVLESVARVQAQQSQQAFGGFPGQPQQFQPQFGNFQGQQQQSPNPPFTERPGGQAPNSGDNQPPRLTAEERMIARTFGMTEEAYAKRKEGMTRNG